MSAGSGGAGRIVNTKGLDLTHSLNAAYAYVSVVVGEGGDTKTFGNFETIGDFSQFDPEKLARGAVEEAVALLGASPVESGEYPVILRWEAAATLLGTFAGIFSAENVQKNFSLLKGKLGEAVAADTITIVDDPLLPQGLYSAPFDAEGVATRTKAVVEAGRLMTFLHNLKTAAKDGVQSTGNAAKGSYKSSVGVAPTNMTNSRTVSLGGCWCPARVGHLSILRFIQATRPEIFLHSYLQKARSLATNQFCILSYTQDLEKNERYNA